MNIQRRDPFTGGGEALERLSVFLPTSLVRALKEQVPAGARGRFIARALREALARKDRREEHAERAETEMDAPERA